MMSVTTYNPFFCRALLRAGFTICAIIVTIVLNAQQFGGNPPSLKWKQIDSDTARIIYPRGLDSIAHNVSNLIHITAKNNQLSLGHQFKKINIVLQNQPVISNGYVGQGPYRSEFYITPVADNFNQGSLPWAGQLALHEYRHVQQYNNFNNGISKWMRLLFGEEGYALATNAAIPNWFFEGDAVRQETVLSPQGRGRMPAFLKAYPSLWEAGKKYSWMKLRNGSLKDYVPNHYQLGYLLAHYGEKKYGNDFWRNVTRDASAYKGLFYPFQKAVKKYTGENYRTFTTRTLSHYKNIYDVEDGAAQQSSLNILPVNKKTVTNYYYPFQVDAHSVIYLKSSYNKRPGFYINTNGKERLLRLRDISIDEQYSYRNGKIVYAAYEAHPRWQWKDYSVIKILDVATNTQKALQHKTRYFSPDISNDGSLIVANHVNLSGQSSLVVLNASNGKIIKEISYKNVAYFSTPKIINNNTVIAAVRNYNAKTYIAKIDINTNTIQPITPPSYTLLGQVDAKNDTIYFSASQNLKDEIWMYDVKQHQLKKLQTPGVGSYFVNAGYNKISWSRFTADGYQLQQINATQAIWKNVDVQHFTNNNSGLDDDSVATSYPITSPVSEYIRSSKPYKKFTRPFNFHSWRPNYNDPEYSFTIYGNNILNTIESRLYYLYNENSRTHSVGGNIVYGALFPHINIGSKYEFGRSAYVGNKLKQWNEWNSHIGMNVPLSWAGNRTYKAFNAGSNLHYRKDFNIGTNNTFKQIQFSYLAHGISWAQQVQSTVQDIYPRWGYKANAQLTHALNLYNSWQSYAGASLYAPGFIRTHSVVLNGAAQYSGSAQKIFNHRIAFARGYMALDSAGIFSAKANYHLPLAYPDWGFANIFYLQRIRANIFYDYTRAFNKNNTRYTTLQSAGAEIYLDTKWWNQHPLSFGFRAGTLLNTLPGYTKKMFWEIILPVSLIPR